MNRRLEKLLPELQRAAPLFKATVHVEGANELRIDLPDAKLYDDNGDEYVFTGLNAIIQFQYEPIRIFCRQEYEDYDDRTVHPHVNANHFCTHEGFFEDWRDAVYAANAEALLASLISCTLVYNTDNPYHLLPGDEDRGPQCETCGGDCGEDYWTCPVCGDTMCEGCVSHCYGCNESFCDSHIARYDDKYCNGWYCQNCRDYNIDNYNMEYVHECEHCEEEFDEHDGEISYYYRDEVVGRGYYCDKCYDELRDSYEEEKRMAQNV